MSENDPTRRNAQRGRIRGLPAPDPAEVAKLRRMFSDFNACRAVAETAAAEGASSAEDDQ